jgi:hypothetical protein
LIGRPGTGLAEKYSRRIRGGGGKRMFIFFGNPGIVNIGKI